MRKELFYQVLITANKKDSYDISHDLTSFTVEEEDIKPNKLTIDVSDPFKVLSHAIQEGMDIEVDVGFIQDHSIIFRGQIHKVMANFPQSEIPKLKIMAYDKTIMMGLYKRNRPWQEPATTLDSIVKTIAERYFLKTQIKVDLKENPEFNGNGIRQNEESDLAFLYRLANKHGCEMYVEENETQQLFYFKSQYKIMTKMPDIKIHHGRCDVANYLLSFEADTNVGNIQLPQMFSGINYKTGQRTEVITGTVDEVVDMDDQFLNENIIEFRKKEPLKAQQLEKLIKQGPEVQLNLRTQLGTVQRIETPSFTTEAELNIKKQHQFSSSNHGMRANGTTLGNHRIRANTIIDIADVGGRFSGTWYLSQVQHILNNKGYQTEFRCQR